MSMTDAPRYTTLMDYLAVLRRQRVLILVIVLTFAGVAYLLSARQSKTYVAEAALSLPEPAETSDSVGLSIGFRLPADQRAAINAELVERPSVAARVKRSLRDQRSINDLLGSVTARAEARTNFLIVEARQPDPERAATLANGFARAFTDQQVSLERRRLRAVVRALRQRLDRLESRPAVNDYTAIGLTDRIARGQALAEVARPVEVVRLAGAPRSPVSPKPGRDALLAALLGLTIAILLAFARESLDQRLRTPRDIERELRLHALTTVRRRTLGRGATDEGKRDALQPRDLEAFRILRANLRTVGTGGPPRTLAVTSPMPEEGKTTVASMLAWVNAASGRRTLLIECDLRRPALAGRMGLQTKPGLVEFLSGAAHASDAIQTIDLETLGTPGMNGHGPREPMLWCMTAGEVDAQSAEMLNSGAFADLIGVVARSYDLVILDTGPLLPIVDSLEILPLVDAVLLCVRVSQTTRAQAAATRAALERLPDLSVGLVVTGVASDHVDAYGYASGDYAVSAS